MDIKLMKKFRNMFLLLFLILVPVSVAFIILGIIFWCLYGNKEEEAMVFAIFFTVLAIITVFLTIKTLYPFFKDLPNVKRKTSIIVEGVVMGFKKVKSNGDPPTTDYYPIVKVDGEDKDLVLTADAELGKRYKFAYLPNTKLAVILEEIE